MKEKCYLINEYIDYMLICFQILIKYNFLLIIVYRNMKYNL